MLVTELTERAKLLQSMGLRYNEVEGDFTPIGWYFHIKSGRITISDFERATDEEFQKEVDRLKELMA